jgi:hypothetical protein
MTDAPRPGGARHPPAAVTVTELLLRPGDSDSNSPAVHLHSESRSGHPGPGLAAVPRCLSPGLSNQSVTAPVLTQAPRAGLLECGGSRPA